MQLLPEWTLQLGVMLVWPHRETDWRPWLTAVEETYLDVVHAISQFEDVLILCRDNHHRAAIVKKLIKRHISRSRCQFAIMPYNDTWIRDYGPLTQFDGQTTALLDFQFNGWGGKFNADQDDLVSRRLHAQTAFGATPLTRVEMILEGGSIDINSQGSLLTTKCCLLDTSRNPHMDKASIDKQLRFWFGATNIHWLNDGYLSGDDTDGHVDTLARFCDDHTIAFSECNDIHDEHYAPLSAMKAQLTQIRDCQGLPYKLLPLPLPKVQFDEQGQRLPANYTNFLIINKAVLVPCYDDPADLIAITRLQQVFGDRQIIGIQCSSLLIQRGSLHCITLPYYSYLSSKIPNLLINDWQNG